MLPNLIDLIIIFWELGDGDLAADNICPHKMRAFLLVFLDWTYLFIFFNYPLSLCNKCRVLTFGLLNSWYWRIHFLDVLK